MIASDSVFSMDGDLAPLEEIVDIAQRSGARTVIDEAHAVGSLGPGGRGAIARAGLEGEVDVLVGTLGKALGSYGAYACASEEMVRLPDQHLAVADLLHRASPARRRRRAGCA